MYIALLGQKKSLCQKKKKKYKVSIADSGLNFVKEQHLNPRRGYSSIPASGSHYEFQLSYNNVLALKTRGEESCLYFHLQQNTNHLKVEANTIDTKVSGEK